MSNPDLIWAAGFIDGEGCFTIAKMTHYNSHRIRLTVGQSNPGPLQFLKGFFGGSLYGKNRHYTWEVTDAAAERVIRALRPYLKVKSDEADILLRFRSRPRNLEFDAADKITLSLMNKAT